jgi:hypothetical protein
MLAEARKRGSAGRFLKLDFRDIDSLNQRFDGVFASGCLYHLCEAEFVTFVSSVHDLLETGGIFYLNMKLGSGEEFRCVPGKGYPGGKQARRLLGGERYYKYYEREELISHLHQFRVLHERLLQYAEKGIEFWMGKACCELKCIKKPRWDAGVI